MFRISRVFLTVAVMVGAPGCGSSKNPSSSACPDQPGATVKVVDNAFEPEVLCVKPATKVTWTFTGRQIHDVAGEGFKSDLLKDGTYEHVFAVPGEYPYRCTIHGGMVGEVRVLNG